MAQFRVTNHAETDQGKVRSSNQDRKRIDDSLSDMVILAVADGMGGHAGGEIASQLAINSFFKELKRSLKNKKIEPELVHKELENAVRKSNSAVFNKSNANSNLRGMGTTLTVAVILDGIAIFANVGDSRGYLVSNTKIQQITKDHSFVEELITKGKLSKEEAQNHPNRNIITRSIGTNADVSVDIFRKELNLGDIIFLCSDGLYPLVSDSEIEESLNSKESIKKICESLIKQANTNGGPDNITVAIGKVDKLKAYNKNFISERKYI